MSDASAQIQETISANDVVLYMKGTKSMPQCGFSSRVAGVLNYMGVDYADVNVLSDETLRQGIKDFSDWPTIPQLYVKGEFVGIEQLVQLTRQRHFGDDVTSANEFTFDVKLGDCRPVREVLDALSQRLIR